MLTFISAAYIKPDFYYLRLNLTRKKKTSDFNNIYLTSRREPSCPDCRIVCVSQTGRYFLTRYTEQLHFFRNNNSNSIFTQNVLENDHSVGSVDDILVAVHVSTKVPHLDTLEKFYPLEKPKYGIKR
jgi:hypothetical protein